MIAKFGQVDIARIALVLALSGWCARPLAAQDVDVETFECDSTLGWVLTNPMDRKQLEGAHLTVSDGALSLSYDRSKLTVLAHSALLTELREIRLLLRSKRDVMLALALEDRDGAKFHYPFSVPAGRQIEVRARPSAFKLNKDSPVRKDRLDPARLGSGYGLFDVGPLVGATGNNVLTIERVRIGRAALPKTKGDLVVERTVTISASSSRSGNIFVNGGHLKITAPRYLLNGNIRVVRGTVEISGSTFSMPQQFNHQRSIELRDSSRLVVRGALVTTGFPVKLGLSGSSSFEVENSRFQGGVTCNGDPGSSVTLRGALTPGEFILGPATNFSATDSESLLIWLVLGPNLKGRLVLPPGENVKRWSAGHGLQARLRNCSKVLWGIVSAPGSDGEIADTDLRAAGFVFGGRARTTLRNLHNKSRLKDYVLDASDRKLRFTNSTVAAWNFYATGKAHVTVEKSTSGEFMSFENALIEVRDSTCDGTGGYVGSHHNSTIRLSNSKLTCLVAARDSSTIVLENCEVVGDVRAAESATIKLVHTRVRGRIICEPGATIITK